MNENQVESLLSQHGIEILRRRTFELRRRNRAWKPILVTGMAAIAVGAFLLLPRNAEAAKIVKIKNAMKHVLSSEIRMSARYNGGPWKEFSKQISKGGRQRIDASIGKGCSFTMIFDSQKTWTSYQGLPFSTVDRSDANMDKSIKEFAQDPLAAAMSVLDGNPDSSVYKLKTTPAQNGFYTIDYSRNDNANRNPTTLHIVVEEATNLPSESLHTTHFDWGTQEVRATYKYGNRIDANAFEVDRSKTLYDMKSERHKFAIEWSNIKSDSSVAPIYSASMTPDGTIWIAYGMEDVFTDKPKKNFIPSGLIAGSAKYIFAWEFPASFASINKDFRIKGKQVVFAAFVPLYASTQLTTNMLVQFGSREIQKPGEISSEAPTKKVSMTAEKLSLPEYMIGFGFQREFLRASITFWDKKAQARQALGDLPGAIEAYEEEVKAYEAFVVYASYRPMLKAADCYEKLGNLEKATQLREKAAELQRTRIR